MRWLRFFRPSGSTRLHWAGMPTHGVGRNPGMPHLAAAQIPGPGPGRILAGEDAAIPDAAADPVEKQGRVGRRRPSHRKS